MRALALSLLMIPWVAEAVAQVVPVTSGDHDGFTRIVLTLPDAIDWEMERSTNLAEVRFPNAELSFDTDQVFDRIGRDRLTAVETKGDHSLVLRLGCPCEVTSFWHDERMLVVDIKDDPPGLDREQENLRENFPMRALFEVGATGPAVRRFYASELVAERFDRATEQTAAMGPKARPAQAAGDGDFPESSRNRLLREVARAAAQGLLSPRRPSPASGSAEAGPTPIQEKESPLEAARPQALEAPENHINLNARTSIDRDVAAALHHMQSRTMTPQCPPQNLFDIRTWGDERPFSRQLGERRSQLTDAVDRTRQSAVVALAKLYVRYGFGAEARRVLANAHSTRLTIEVLRAMAAVLEDDGTHAPSVMMDHVNCPSAAALWSALVHSSLPTDAPVATDAILRAFGALPKELRSFLGPRLAKLFLDSGRKNAGQDILRTLERRNHSADSVSPLLRSEVAVAEGDIETAVEILHRAATSDSGHSAEALDRLIDLSLTEGREIPPDLADLAGAYAHEQGDGPLGPALARAYVLALAASNDFETAHRELERLDSVLKPRRKEVVEELLHLLVTKADDITFLHHVLAVQADSLSEVRPETATLIAARLVEIGFPDRAAELLALDQDGATGRKRRLLRAEIALSRGRPRQAQAELLGLVGRDVNLLRARARSLAGEHAASRDLFQEFNQEAQAEREAWLAGMWSFTAQSKNAARAELASFLTEKKSASRKESGQSEEAALARNRNRLKQSRDLRVVLGKLLAMEQKKQSGGN